MKKGQMLGLPFPPLACAAQTEGLCPMSPPQMRPLGKGAKFTPHHLAWGVSSISQGATVTAATQTFQKGGKVPQDLLGIHPTR